MKQLDRLRVGLTILTTLAIWSLLIWQHFHGGVPVHYLLHDPDMPRFSNWIGGILLPVLAWGLLGLSKRRVMAADVAGLKPVVIGLLAGIAFGAAMSVSFLSGHETVAASIFFSLLPLALLLPVHRPECLLGFVLGMSTTFGAVLATLFGSIMALATFLIHRFIGLPLRRLAGRRTRSDHSAQS